MSNLISSQRHEDQISLMALQQKRKDSEKITYPFWFGGLASCFAACITHPLDLTKVRMQNEKASKPKLFKTIFNVVKNEGLFSLYNGLSASLLRQATYSTVRFGIYDLLKIKRESQGIAETPSSLLMLAIFSGIVGGIVGNPGDVVNIRMQMDAGVPIGQRMNYKNAIDGLFQLTKTEGIISWTKGLMPNTIRSMLMTTSQFVGYDISKKLLTNFTPIPDGLELHFVSSLVAALLATTITSPVDVVKTRIMSSSNNQKISSIIKNGLRQHGILYLFRGWTASFSRLGPHTIATFVILEQLRKLYSKVSVQ